MNKYYIIYRNATDTGFFSNFFHILGHILIANTKGLIPVVDMKSYPTVYNENNSVLGTMNSWEYYFQPLAGEDIDDVYASGDYVMCDGEFKHFIYELCSKNSKVITALIEKYIRPKDYIMDAVNGYISSNFKGKRVLGVHFRGWEMAVAPGHPKPPTYEQLLDRIYMAMGIYPVDKIYLVTEQSDYVDMLKKEFGDKLIYYPDYYRTPYKVNAYKMYPEPRENHKYLLGKEVLIDTLILSRADYLICGGHPKYTNLSGSNVATAAIVMNNNNYKYVDFIYNGINEGSKDSTIYRDKAQKAWQEGKILSAVQLYRKYLTRKIKGK